MPILWIIILILLFGGGFGIYGGYGPLGWSPLGLILVIVVLYYLFRGRGL